MLKAFKKACQRPFQQIPTRVKRLKGLHKGLKKRLLKGHSKTPLKRLVKGLLQPVQGLLEAFQNAF